MDHVRAIQYLKSVLNNERGLREESRHEINEVIEFLEIELVRNELRKVLSEKD